MKKNQYIQTKNQLKRLVGLQLKALKLPQLSGVERAKLDHAFAIDQLYYSSRLEGSQLTREMIDKAIHGKKFSAA